MDLVYIGDPMCSWCWGFLPVLRRLRQERSARIEVRVGGLRPGPAARPLDDDVRAYLWHHWRQVEAASGQRIDPTLLERQNWVYDTELPCRAVVAVRELVPERAFDLFARLQEAFYRDAVDITCRGSYPALLRELELPVGEVVTALVDDANRARTYREFRAVRRLGVTAFPALFLRRRGRLAPVARGFVDDERLAAALERLGVSPHGAEPAAPA